jgi:hypoxanthine phosphoribosyltransferase
MRNNIDQTEIVPDNYKIFIPEEEIQNRIQEMGKQIAKDFAKKNPILLGVLNGGFIFLADLIRYINIDVEMDFIRISSYGNEKESSGHIKILKSLNADIKDRHVIVVEDIVDSGLSIEFLKNMLNAFGPAGLSFVTLLNKPLHNKTNVKLDYVGFEIEDKYVVGYGLDDEQLKRNLRSIYIIDE